MFLALVFQTGSDYSEAKKLLGPTSVISVNEKIFLIPEEAEEKDLRKGIVIPYSLKDYVRLLVIPKKPVIDTIGLKYSVFINQECIPLTIESGSDDWIKNYIIVEPDTDFYEIEIIATKRENKINKMVNRRHYSFEVDDDDGQFFITGSKKEEKCFDIDCFDKEIRGLFKYFKRN